VVALVLDELALAVDVAAVDPLVDVFADAAAALECAAC
jgi:hypothetical protein